VGGLLLSARLLPAARLLPNCRCVGGGKPGVTGCSWPPVLGRRISTCVARAFRSGQVLCGLRTEFFRAVAMSGLREPSCWP
jgi:hypothetical protein